MDIQTRKIEFVQAFLKLQNEKLVARFKKLLNREAKPSISDSLKPKSIEELNKRIDKSETILKIVDLQTR
jgi:hypothetical protein